MDTAAWVAAADSRDTAGSAVREARDQWLSSGGMLTTTDYVIDETLTTVRFRLVLMRLKLGGSKSTARLDCGSSLLTNREETGAGAVLRLSG